MGQEIQLQAYRDVQTLLFCKISPTPPPENLASETICDNLYQKIAHIKDSSVHAFLTFGEYDAICVYPTEIGPDETNWLESIYRDKQNIIRMPSNNVMCHQMHLVSQCQDTREIWTVDNTEYPFFLATLIYGVNVEDPECCIRDGDEQAAEAGCTISSGIECSRYEQRIRMYLRQRFCKKKAAVKYAIYNGITAGDVVVLWRAKDLQEIMDLIAYLEYSDIARMTLTTLGFPIQSNGQVAPCVFDTLIKHLHKNITVSMRGSIRGLSQFLALQDLLAEPQHTPATAKIKTELLQIAKRAYDDPTSRQQLKDVFRSIQSEDTIDKALQDSDSAEAFLQQLTDPLTRALNNLSCALPKRIWSQSLGKSEFTVSASVSYANLANLLAAYRTHHTDFYYACWEILTDVRTEPSHESAYCFQASKMPSDIMGSLYSDFQELYRDSSDLNLNQYSWANALQEILGSHHYIDHHPALHGPSYLVYTSLKIACAYLSGQVTDFESIEQRRRLLKRSEENFIHFIQNLDQLTEQLSRNDDAMLNNRSNAHSIHFSLPESALEFYHAFLRRIVDYLMRYDEEKNLKPEDFEYDLLLSPKTCSGFQFRPILRTEHSDQNSRSNLVWPHKQAYVLELPVERIFKPLHVFFPVIHECFHVFGDVLRQRSKRRQYMSAFIATNLLNAAGFGQQQHQPLLKALTKAIHAPSDTDSSDYLDATCQQLQRNTYRLFDPDTQSDLEKYFAGPDAKQTLQLWEIVRQRLSTIDLSTSASADKTKVTDAILNNCYVFFKECYADAMSIALLKLTPSEYLECSREYIRRFHNQYTTTAMPTHTPVDKLSSPALRHAIVLAACCRMQHYLPQFSIRKCTDAIWDFRTAKDESESTEGFDMLSTTLKGCFDALVDAKLQMPAGSSLHPPAALNYVIAYLTSSIDLMYRDPPTLECPEKAPQSRYTKYTLEDLSGEFDRIIRKGNMFGKDFYDIIYDYHQKIRDEISASKKKADN